MRHPLEYVRTDRNGTKIFHDWNCPRCGGAGESDKWIDTGKTCWGCNGTGARPKPSIVKEYTPEHAAKLEARRAAREAKRLAENPSPTQGDLEAKADETRRNNWKHEGFREDGVGYAHTGNTYYNKDALNDAGGRWCPPMRAYIAPNQIKGMNGIKITEVHANDLCDQYGWIDWKKAREFNI